MYIYIHNEQAIENKECVFYQTNLLKVEGFLSSQNQTVSTFQYSKVKVFSEVLRFTPSHLFFSIYYNLSEHIHKTIRVAAVLLGEVCSIRIVILA